MGFAARQGHTNSGSPERQKPVAGVQTLTGLDRWKVDLSSKYEEPQEPQIQCL